MRSWQRRWGKSIYTLCEFVKETADGDMEKKSGRGEEGDVHELVQSLKKKNVAGEVLWHICWILFLQQEILPWGNHLLDKIECVLLLHLMAMECHNESEERHKTSDNNHILECISLGYALWGTYVEDGSSMSNSIIDFTIGVMELVWTHCGRQHYWKLLWQLCLWDYSIKLQRIASHHQGFTVSSPMFFGMSSFLTGLWHHLARHHPCAQQCPLRAWECHHCFDCVSILKHSIISRCVGPSLEHEKAWNRYIWCHMD